MELLCKCTKCKSIITLHSVGMIESKQWYEFTCQDCGYSGYINEQDYKKWFKEYRRRSKK